MSISPPPPRKIAPESVRGLAALILSIALLAGPVSYLLVRQGWLTPLGGIGGFGAIELAALGVVVAIMVRSVDAHARAMADTLARRRAVDNLQAKAASMLEEISGKSRE